MTPKGWRKLPLADVATIQTGIAKGARKAQAPVEIPYLRVANVQDGFLDLSEIKTIEVDRSRIERYLLQHGDVLLTEGGDFDKLGRGSVWRGEIGKCVHQNHVFVVRTNPEVLLPEYLSILTGSSYGKSYFRKCSKQSTNLASMNSTQLKAFPVLLPSISEQSSIVESLSHWDQAINKTERLVTVKERQFHWTLCSLLTKENITGEWKKIGDLCDIDLILEKGKPLTNEERIPGNVPVVAGGKTYAYFHNTSTHNMNTITISASGAYAGYVWYHDYPIWASDCNVLHAKSADISVRYLYFVLKSQQEKLYALQSGGAQPHVYAKDVILLKLLVPPIKAQRKIENILDAAEQEIQLLNLLKEAYVTQRRGITNKIFSENIT
ncbi:MAG TPA: restriction endonuclease subunit S [Firmicutes bacterium]|jgi:type I restriction enzyme S subunit|nr:restriction endonuclease subunit S [Bacillota bacterium]